jgi:hypothetical protein
MGIRHIAGPKEWGAYQQAQLITELHDSEGYDFKSVGEHLGISAVEAARRYRAMNALKYMEQDELYADKAEPKFYRLFHELVSLPVVRERFGWNSESNRFSDVSKSREFFELIAPDSNGDSTPKITSYAEVRKLKTVVGHPMAEVSLSDPEQPLTEAFKIAETDKDRTGNVDGLLQSTLKELKKISFADVKSLTREQIALVDEVIAILTDFKSHAAHTSDNV